MNVKPIPPKIPSIKDGLDRQNIAILRKRFLAVNADRLDRLRSALSDRQQLFMDILPLLFHSNHPMLPGFVSRSTPAKICHFKPSKKDMLAGRAVAKSFTIPYDPSPNQIMSIFIMGSVGTVAQSQGSDLDIWVCYLPELAAKEVTELDAKCQRISEWAASLRLEVNFFLMDHEAFKAQRLTALDKDSSGSAQRLLLLDEFYRTAILVAGNTPLWWFVPADCEREFEEYTNKLLHYRFLPKDTVVDFGGVGNIPAGEFLGAGIWQLYKAISAPYKSVLKLMLLEAYVSEYPDIHPLSLTFKSRLYEGELDIDTLDSYVMVYQRIEDYLAQKRQFKRLELARRCFYFKVNKPLSRTPTLRNKSWQRLLLEQMTRSWGWDKSTIRFLDSRPQWKAQEVRKERGLLVAELDASYRFLMNFAESFSKSRSISSDELVVLGRKLQAAFEQKPGKIDWINPALATDITEDVLIFERILDSQLKSIWAAYTPATLNSEEQQVPITSAPNLIEVMLWCYFNCVLTPQTRIEFESDAHLSTLEARRLINAFQDWLPLPLPEPPHFHFQHSAKPKTVLFLVNAGKSPTPELDSRGYQIMSDKSDALSYGGFDENLVVAMDIVIQNSWNEVQIRRFEGKTALLDSLTEYLHMTLPGTHQSPPEVSISCIGNAHSTTITQRVEQWISEISDCYFSDVKSQHKRFIFHLASAYYCMQFQGMKPVLRTCRNIGLLLNHLASEQKHYSPIVIDSRALEQHPLKAISKHTRQHAINVFFERIDEGIDVYIVDEMGSLIHSRHTRRPAVNTLRSLQQFLRAVTERQAQHSTSTPSDFGVTPIHLVELSRQQSGHYKATSRSAMLGRVPPSQLDIKVVVRADDESILGYDFYCKDEVFNAHPLDKSFFKKVNDYILARRTHHDTYPLHITELDLNEAKALLSPSGQLQTMHYLRIKQQLETELNRIDQHFS